MAGSYHHCVDDDSGKLLISPQVQSMLECHSGDVYEAVEEMYGMIWWLAANLSDQLAATTAAELVERACNEYQEGLRISPGTDGRLPDD